MRKIQDPHTHLHVKPQRHVYYTSVYCSMPRLVRRFQTCRRLVTAESCVCFSCELLVWYLYRLKRTTTKCQHRQENDSRQALGHAACDCGKINDHKVRCCCCCCCCCCYYSSLLGVARSESNSGWQGFVTWEDVGDTTLISHGCRLSKPGLQRRPVEILC
jgi:hypothetical protein